MVYKGLIFEYFLVLVYFHELGKTFFRHKKTFSRIRWWLDFFHLILFSLQISQCYPKELEEFPQQLIDLLQRHSTVLDPEMRMVTFLNFLLSPLAFLAVCLI